MLSKEQILILNEWQTLYFRDDNMPEYGYIYKKECIKDHKISTFYTIELHIIPETGCWLINVFYNNIECICNCVEDNAHSIPRFKRDIDYKSFLREIEIRQYSKDVISFIKDTVQQLQHLQTDENQDKLKIDNVILPEHHGRLVDIDKFLHDSGLDKAMKYGSEDRSYSYSTMMMYEIAEMLDDIPVVVEATDNMEGK